MEDLEVKRNDINGDDGPSGIVLQCACEESLGKEETRDPEHRRNSIVYPILDEFNPLHKISHPGGKGLQGWVCLHKKKATGSTRYL